MSNTRFRYSVLGKNSLKYSVLGTRQNLVLGSALFFIRPARNWEHIIDHEPLHRNYLFAEYITGISRLKENTNAEGSLTESFNFILGLYSLIKFVTTVLADSHELLHVSRSTNIHRLQPHDYYAGPALALGKLGICLVPKPGAANLRKINIVIDNFSLFFVLISSHC